MWTVVSGQSTITWTGQAASTTSAWQGIAFVSVESRFNPVYPQTESLGIVPFIWRVQSEGNFYVASGSGVFIRSSITEAVY